jgi:hypothetical protein
MLQKMSLIRPLARAMVVLFCGYAAACGGDGVTPTPDPPEISSVSPNPIVEGQTAVLTGANFSEISASNTVKLDNLTLSVTEASATSLTVIVPAGCGPLRSASLQVTAGGAVGSAFDVTVAPDPAGAATQDVELAVGEQVVFRQPRHCLGLPTNGGAAQYLVGVQSTGRNGAATREVTVTGILSGAPTAVSSGPVAAKALNVLPRFNPLPEDFGENSASRLIQRHYQRHDALMADLIRPVRNAAVRNAAGAFAGTSPQRAPARVVVDGSEMVGDSVDLRVRRLGGNCSAVFTDTVTAQLRVKTARSMWWVDVDNPADGFLDTDLQAMSVLFDDVIYATEVAEFGDVGDLDGNERIAILITKKINEDTTTEGQLLGFVNPCDFFLRDDGRGLVSSNEGEFFYTLAPDPNGEVGEVISVATLVDVLPSIIAHEFAHIIQFSRRAPRLFTEPDLEFMAPFVAEGQATLAEEIVGHVVLANTTGQNLDGNVAFNFLPETQPFAWYFSAFVDLVQYFGWPDSPDLPRIDGAPQECTWIDGGVSHPCGGRPLWYGVTWSFLRWASDLYGGALGGEAAFQTALIDGDLSGFDNLEEALSVAGQGTLEDHLARWAAALYMDGRPGASAENSMSSWDLFSVSQMVVETAWLHPVEYGFANFSETVTVRDPSTAYFLVGGPGNSSFTLRVSTPSGTDLPSDVQVWVVRTK